MNRTAQIIAEMKAENSAILNPSPEATEAQDVERARKVKAIQSGRNVTGERYSLATGTGRTAASSTSFILLKGTEDIRNGQRRDASLPRRAMSMCASRGRVRPDMLESLMAFFGNPTSMAQGLLASFLPVKLDHAASKATLDSLGISVDDAKLFTSVMRQVNPSSGRAGRSPRRVSIFSPGVAPTVDAKRRGRPSGPKYVEFLSFGQAPVQTCEDVSGIPGGNDVAQGAGHDQGQGWDSARTLTPAQITRRSVALDSSSHGFRSIGGVVVDRW